MSIRIYWIGKVGSGRLGIMPRPRGGEWLEDEISSLKREGVNVVVSLLEAQEIEELALEEEGPLCEREGFRYLSLPIPDQGVPASRIEAEALLHSLLQDLAAGRSAVIHCRQGIGRSGTIAASLLALAGVPPREALLRVSQARGVPVPETRLQLEWVERFARSAPGGAREP